MKKLEEAIAEESNYSNSVDEISSNVFNNTSDYSKCDEDVVNTINSNSINKLYIEVKNIRQDLHGIRTQLEEIGFAFNVGEEEKRYLRFAKTSRNKMGMRSADGDISNLSEIEKDLNDFYKYCKENNLTQEEIAQICQPLSERAQRIAREGYIRKLGLVFAIFTLLYLLSYLEFFSWQYSAIGRLFLIELLPIWNWQALKTEKCLISAPAAKTNAFNNRDADPCTFCEYLNSIDVADAFNNELIYEHYIKLHRPVILENGFENWNRFDSNNSVLDAMLDDKVLSKSYPCKFASNVYNNNGNLQQLIKDHKNHNVYFLHFQNCQFDAVKSFRKYFQRPGFLVPEIYPIQYSWIISSKNYKVEKYKKLDFDDGIMIMGQVVGKSEIMLQSDPCPDDCLSLRINLAQGEVLIFTNEWSFSYLPQFDGENLAIVLETH